MTEYVKDGIIVEGQRGALYSWIFVVVISGGSGASGSDFILSDFTHFSHPGIVILVNHQGRKTKLGTTDSKIF